jgi:hypothetical protein
MDTGPLPEIFSDLISFADSLGSLTEEGVEHYCELLQEDHSLTPELLAVVGASTFKQIVAALGGQSLKIPRAEEILKRIQDARK